MLTLSWADILRKVPAQLATKSLDIPFTILHKRFEEVVGAISAPIVYEDDSDPEEIWNLSQFPGISVAADRSDPVSEAVASDDDADGDFARVAEPLSDGAAPRRSVRIADSGA